MPKGTPVTVTGTTGDVANVAALSSVNTHVPEATGFSNHVFGLTDTTIAAGAFGYIVTEGSVSGSGGDILDTSLFSGGDIPVNLNSLHDTNLEKSDSFPVQLLRKIRKLSVPQKKTERFLKKTTAI